MARDVLDDVICIKIPVLVTMVAVLIVLRRRQRLHTLCREPSAVRNVQRSAHMCRILDGGVHNCVEYMRLVCGDDHMTGEYARTIFHQFGVPDPVFERQPEGLDNTESDPLDDNDHQEQPRSSSSDCNSRPPRALRTSIEDTIMTDIAQAIGQIASSLKGMKKKNWKEKLTDALESLQGYSVEDMELLYVTLRGDRRLAKDFYMRKQILRINFVEQFLAERRASRP